MGVCAKSFLLQEVSMRTYLDMLFDIVLQGKQRTSYQTVQKCLQDILDHIRREISNMIFRDYILVLKVLAVCFAVYIVSRARKRRHRTNAPATFINTANNTVVNIHSNIASTTAKLTNTDNGSRYTTQEIRLNEFRQDFAVETWIVKLERYLLRIDPRDWVDATISHISEDCLQKLGDLNRFYENDNGFELLKSEVK